MTTIDTKDIVTRFVEEFWNQGDVSAADRLMTPDVVIHEPEVGGPAGLKQFCQAMKAAFPDWNSTPEELVSDGDVVAERWTGRGTHKGDFMGIPATGRAVTVPGVVFYRLKGERISEFRGFFDQMSMMRQLGVISG